jgi:hypothetical protein
MSSLLTGVELHPRNVDEALRSLNTVVDRLAARQDARAVFPDVYAIVTRHVAEEVRRQQGFFQEPEWISRLAGRFAERYLETLAWSLEGQGQDCTAWELAHGYAEQGLTFPLQDAALGISAHVNFDLALGLWRTIEEFGDTSPQRLARYKADFDAVNSLLTRSLPETLERLAGRYDCATTAVVAGRALRPVTRTLLLQVVYRWREHVWNNVLGLVQARSELERSRVISRMHQHSGRLGHLFALSSRVRHMGRTLLSAVPRPTSGLRKPQQFTAACAVRVGLKHGLRSKRALATAWPMPC